MKVGYRTKKLAKQAASEKSLVKAFGKIGAKLYLLRLSEFGAANCLEDLRNIPGPRIHELTGNRKNQFSADLQHPYRLIFTPADDPEPLKKEGGWDWKRITIIEILEITDTHD